jgi:hypothetical protein
MKWQQVPIILLEDSSREPVYAGYQPWFIEEGQVAVTRSEYEFLLSIVKLYKAGEITEAQAKACEFSFFFEGWSWVDKINDSETQHRFSTILMKQLLHED